MRLVCRFCLEDKGVLEPLFGTENATLINQIETLNNLLLKIIDFDGWPSGICLDCKSKLTVTHNFIIGYLKTHKILQEEFEANSNNTFDEDDIQTNGSSQTSSQTSSQSSQLEDEDSSSVHSELSVIYSESDFKGFSQENSILESVSDGTDDNGNVIFAEGPKQFVFVCEKCYKICATREGLKQHQRVHSPERPFKCDFCPETFKFKGQANRHTQLHKRKCHKCGILFKRPIGLKTHLRVSRLHHR